MKYSSDFKCLKSECPNTCCKGEVKLSIIDVIKLDKLGINDYEWFIDSRTSNPYALMNTNSDTTCALLRKGLCTIYDKEVMIKELVNQGLSVNAKPLICRVYPEMIFYPEVNELSLNSGCPGVKGMKWDYVNNKSLINEALIEVGLLRVLTRLLTRGNLKVSAKIISDNTIISKSLSIIKKIKKIPRINFLK